MKNPPTIIIDGGANIGLSSIYFANRFKQSRVWAVVPEGTNLEMLKKNVSAYPQIKIIESALWNADTFLKIKDTGENKWAFSVEECLEGEPGAFTGTSVKGLLDQHGIQKVDLLKLDIESAEKELFEKGADEWIPKISNMVIEFHDWMKPGCATSFFSAIAKYPVSITIHDGMLVVNNNGVR